MWVLKLASEIDPDGHLHLDLPTQLPEGSVELVLVINPIQKERKVGGYDFSDLAGKLEWRGDAVAVQRSLRGEKLT